MFKIFAFILLILSTTQLSMAGIFYNGQYRLGIYKDSKFNADKITHIILVGSAVKEDSDQFFQSGISRAERYKELWPEDQVVILSSPEVKDTADQKVFDDFNIAVVKVVQETFTADKLIAELRQFSKIASIDFYGHSSPWSIKLGKHNAAFDPSVYAKSLQNLRSRFLPNAYITLNGCNSGFNIAPALSSALLLPVSGSLTSTVFERIESDGHWYKEDDWTPENYVEINDASFEQRLACSMGYCWRMKPTRYSYSSYWGTFDSGLSFYKFFCNFDENSDHRCEKGMAKSLLSFPSVHPLKIDATEEEYKKVVYDWICSTGGDKNYFQRCVAGIKEAITRGDLVFRSHPGNELACDLKGCKVKIACKERKIGSGIKGGSCKLEAKTNPAPTTAAREMLNFLKGFTELNKH